MKIWKILFEQKKTIFKWVHNGKKLKKWVNYSVWEIKFYQRNALH